MAAVRIFNGSNEITSAVDWSSVDLVMVLTKEKGTLYFEMKAPQAPILPSNIPTIGNTVYLEAQTTGSYYTLFGGTVTELETVNANSGGDGGILLTYQITCQDWGFAFDSKVVKYSFVNMDPADIVDYIVNNFTSGGFTTTHVQRGNFLVASIQFNYEQPTKCLEALANQIGWEWYIDPNKNVYFFPPQDIVATAPIVIDDSSGHLEWATLDVDVNITNLKNSIYVVGGTKQLVVTQSPGYGQIAPVDIYTSVNNQLVYPLAYKYSTASLTVTLAGVGQSIGTDQVTDPTTVQVLYNNDGPFLRFTSNPGAGSQIEVTGTANIPILAHVTDSVSIATYGEYQDSIVDAQIGSIEEAQERAYADLYQYSHPVYDVKFTTIDPLSVQLYIGQTIFLNSTKYGVSNYPLVIKRIEATGRTPTQLEFQVEAIGSDVVTYTDMMLYLLQQQNAQTVTNPSTVLQVLVDYTEVAVGVDAVTMTNSGSAPYLWGVSSPQPYWSFFSWD